MSASQVPAPSCPRCGAPAAADDRFCGACGAPVAAAPAGAGDSLWDYVRQRLQVAVAGEFEVLRSVGRGGMAAVFLAREVALNRQVAIKVMSPALLAEEGMVERFRHEAVTVAKLSHPNVVTIHAVRQVGDLHFFVMSFVEGCSLESLLQESGPLPLPLVRSIAFQVGQGLAYAHRQGVVHRDVKPANLLLNTEGNAVVTDFGIAKVKEVSGLTQTGLMIGTPAYMSPEQWLGAEVTPASDQYSLGVVIHEMLTGTPPFTGPTLAVVMQGHLHRPVPPVREARPECPADVEAAVMRMLDKDPGKRWPGIPQALAALGAAALSTDAPVPEPAAPVEVPAAPAPVPTAAGTGDVLPVPAAGPVSATALFGGASAAAQAPSAGEDPGERREGAFPHLRGRRRERRRRGVVLAACGVVVVGAGVGVALAGSGREEAPDSPRPAVVNRVRAAEPASSPAPPAAVPGPAVAPVSEKPAAPPDAPERKDPQPRVKREAPAPEEDAPVADAGAERRVQGVVDRFVRVLATGDARRVRALYPGLSGSEPWWRYAEARADSALRVHFFQVQDGYPEVAGDSAVVLFDVSFVRAGSGELPRPWLLKAVLERDGSRWRIAEVRYY
ncbi:MAG: serine/threonine-protein kinase [Gemmatimonadota bacterium]